MEATAFSDLRAKSDIPRGKWLKNCVYGKGFSYTQKNSDFFNKNIIKNNDFDFKNIFNLGKRYDKCIDEKNVSVPDKRSGLCQIN